MPFCVSAHVHFDGYEMSNMLDLFLAIIRGGWKERRKGDSLVSLLAFTVSSVRVSVHLLFIALQTTAFYFSSLFFS